ncbi:Gos1 protein [Martiniozyma asiatica (nom. inval.)]|nr:Gos1 protein [Martiniozyma asiatica]
MSSQFAQTRSALLSSSVQLSDALALFAKFSHHTSTSATAEEIQSQGKVEELLDNFATLIKELQRIVDFNASIPATKLQQLTRHKDELSRFKIDYQRIKLAIEQERNRLNLMFSVREDIAEHNNRNRGTLASENPMVSGMSDDDYMLNERSRANDAHNVIDGLISQVLDTRDEILRQRNILSSVGGRLESVLVMVPGLGDLIGKIDARHRKEALIISFVAIILLLILWFSL